MSSFSSPPDPVAYRFQVWELVRKVPAGQVTTYGQIAHLIAPPPGVEPDNYRSLGPRWVGGAMSACPSDVPWQRVVNSEGKVSLRGGGLTEQRELLETEGVVFDDRGRIDLKKFGWIGPDQA
jgi:methylated-DNA-protein-cysteine methyltransferase-like protein